MFHGAGVLQRPRRIRLGRIQWLVAKEGRWFDGKHVLFNPQPLDSRLDG